MVTPELTVETTVTTVTSTTSFVLTPTVDRWDQNEGGKISTITVAGTGFTGYRVGDRVRVRING